MKAFTVWQPWASLIMIGAKPFEFRRWDYRERERDYVFKTQAGRMASMKHDKAES